MTKFCSFFLSSFHVLIKLALLLHATR